MKTENVDTMNTEQLKTAEETFAEQMEDYKTRLMASIMDFHSKHPIKELTDFASQESKRAVDEFKEKLISEIDEAIELNQGDPAVTSTYKRVKDLIDKL